MKLVKLFSLYDHLVKRRRFCSLYFLSEQSIFSGEPSHNICIHLIRNTWNIFLCIANKRKQHCFNYKLGKKYSSSTVFLLRSSMNRIPYRSVDRQCFFRLVKSNIFLIDYFINRILSAQLYEWRRRVLTRFFKISFSTPCLMWPKFCFVFIVLIK